VLFLAVFLGFLAENIREGYSENLKAKRYINDLILDLQEDSANTAELFTRIEAQAIAIDTFVSIRNMDFTVYANRELFWILFSETYAYDIPSLIPNETTINQLINTGSLAIIDPEVARTISKYDLANQSLKSYKVTITMGQEWKRIYELCDYPTAWENNKPKPPFVDDKLKMMAFFNHMADFYWSILAYQDLLRKHFELNKELLSKIRKHY
jgi:hypothetical protein